MKRRQSTRATAFQAELDEMRPKVIERAQGMCELCKAKPVEVIHHKLRRSQGGTNALDNLWGLCNDDHLYIHKHPAESYAQGWLHRSTSSVTF